MKNYKINIQETLSRIIEIEAENEDIALEIVKNKYKNEELVLDNDDFVCVEIGIQNEELI